MEDDGRRFDEDATTLNFGDELEFDDVAETDLEVVELLCARVKAAGYIA